MLLPRARALSKDDFATWDSLPWASLICINSPDVFCTGDDEVPASPQGPGFRNARVCGRITVMLLWCYEAKFPPMPLESSNKQWLKRKNNHKAIHVTCSNEALFLTPSLYPSDCSNFFWVILRPSKYNKQISRIEPWIMVYLEDKNVTG